MTIKCLMPCLIVLLCACTALKQSGITQGISGTVYLLRGNQMPVIGRPQSKGKAVSRDIFIYEATNISQTEGSSPLFSHINTRLVARTKSDSTGHYAVALPAGKYSVFVADGPKFFAAITDGDGMLNPTVVMVKNVSKKDITITINATY